MDKAGAQGTGIQPETCGDPRTGRKIFAAKGFHNTTVAEIAGASGFAVGTLYQFFESKEQLYTAMLTEKLNMMYSDVRSRWPWRRIPSERSNVWSFTIPVRRKQCGVLQHLHPGDHLSIRGKRGASDTDGGPITPSTPSFTEEVIREGIRCEILKEMDPRMMGRRPDGHNQFLRSKWLAMMKAGRL